MNAQGSRAPLLLLPGLACDRGTWAAQIADLSPDVDCRVPEWGLLDDLGDMARHALAVCDAPRLWVAGHSMGGRVALEMWRLAPERIAGLALLNTGHQAMAPGRPGVAERRNRHNLLRIAQRDGMRAMAQQWARGMVHPAHRDGPLWTSVLDMLARATPQQYAAQIQALLRRPDASPLLPDVHCPTLLLCGAQDSWSPPQRHRDMAAMMPAARYVEVAECGHMSPMEQAGAVTQALRDWLSRSA